MQVCNVDCELDEKMFSSLCISSDVKDPKEVEVPQMFVLLQKRQSGQSNAEKQGTVTPSQLHIVVNQLANLVKSNPKNIIGTSNLCFSRSNDAVHWNWLDVVEQATGGKNSDNELHRLFNFSNQDVPIFASHLFQSLKQAVRKRRSALNFINSQSITFQDFCFICESATKAFDVAPNQIEVIGLYVHRVSSLQPGIYLIVRNQAVLAKLLESDKELTKLNEITNDSFILLHKNSPTTLLPSTYKETAPTKPQTNLEEKAYSTSCSQRIASDSAVTFVMFARGSSLFTSNRSYKWLHWCCGVIGQLLYISSTVRGLAACGMGCFLDAESSWAFFGKKADTEFFPLYHFAVGKSNEDVRFKQYEYDERTLFQ